MNPVEVGNMPSVSALLGISMAPLLLFPEALAHTASEAPAGAVCAQLGEHAPQLSKTGDAPLASLRVWKVTLGRWGGVGFTESEQHCSTGGDVGAAGGEHCSTGGGIGAAL